MEKDSEIERLKLFQFILNSAQDSIFTKNLDHEYTYINPAMANLFGCEPAELLGKTPADIFSEEDAGIVNEVDNKTFQGKHVSEQKKIKIGSEEKLFHTIQSPMYDTTHQIIGICGIVRDLTDFSNLQLQLIQTEKTATIGQLAAGIAHEFNNLLAIISLNAELTMLKKEKTTLSEKTVRNLNNIVKTVSKGKSIVSDIISFAKPSKPMRRFYNIESIIEDVLRLQEHQIEYEHIRICRSYNSTPKLFFDRSQFEQVFLNLFVNARHAIIPKEKGEIRIATYVKNDQVIVKISDNGIGMNKDVKKRLFTPFFTTKGAFAKDNLGINGTGLGLSIASTILQNHGAKITVESEPEVGTTFTVAIPIPEQYATLESDTDEGECVCSGSGNIDVLLIDDEVEFARPIMEILEAWECNVTYSDGGVEGIQRARERQFDLILLDMSLPDISGENIYKEIRKFDPRTRLFFYQGNRG